MITAYALYMAKQAGELGAALGSVAHLADDVPMAYHWLHGTNPPPLQQQQPNQPGQAQPRPTV